MTTQSRLYRFLQGAIYLLATLQFIRFYVVSTTAYLNMTSYRAGQERLPFQYRILPVLLMWPIDHAPFLIRHFSHPNYGWDAASASAPQTFSFYLISLISFSLAGLLTTRLYRAVHPRGVLAWLVYPIFLILVLWTYVIHIDADFSYPYDMPSLAFFAGGLLAIYTRRFLPLAFVMFFGTMNRETTLFLVGIYLLDAASRQPLLVSVTENHQTQLRLRDRFSLAQVPWMRVAFLSALWLTVKIALAHRFVHNSRAEDYVRIRENLHRLSPRLWPVLFDVCGYVLPVVVLLRRRLAPLRFANYLYILPLWIAVMFYTGVILEIRIWGELCTYTAVASTLLIEEYVLRVGKRTPAEPAVNMRRAA